MNKKIRVICCGNPLRGDDGAGCEICRILKEAGLGSHVEVIDGGISGINLLPLFSHCRAVIVVDAVLTDREPGRVKWFEPDDIRKGKPIHMSSHEFNPSTLLRMAEMLNGPQPLPAIFFLGIDILPPPAGFSETLSPAVRKGLPLAAEKIISKIRSLENDAPRP